MNLLITNIGREELLRTALGKIVQLLATGLSMHSGRKVKKKSQGTDKFKLIMHLT
jgi:hypothetical protein